MPHEEKLSSEIIKSAKLNEKQKKKQEQILNGKIVPTILAIGLPLAFYNFTNYLYGIFDLVIISRFGIGSVDGVAILEQIRTMISTLGAAITVAGTIIIARKVGAGDMTLARKSANNLFMYILVLSAVILGLIIPFANPFLLLLGTPEHIITEYKSFFNIQMINTGVVLLNGVFIGIEKSRGNTKRLLYLNFIVMAIKVTLNLVFVNFIPDVTTSYIALATLLAQSSLLIFALVILFNPSNQLGISLKFFKFDPLLLKSVISIAFPIFVGRFLFSFGKVLVNAQATAVYGSAAVGALALSNSVCGAVSAIFTSLEETSSVMINQNYGNKNIKRTFEIFKKVNIISITVGLVGLLLLSLFRENIVNFLIPISSDMSVAQIAELEHKRHMLMVINSYEAIAFPMLALDAASTSFLLGYGKSSLVMLTATARIFLFRVPPLLFMMHVLNVNWASTGMVMGLSNFAAGVLGFIFTILLIRKIKRNNGYKELTYN